MIQQVLAFFDNTIAVAILFIMVLLPIVMVWGVVHFMKHRNKAEEPPTEL
jgi:fumarate reductase subunit D